jgi:hypothetical protein
MVCLGNICVNTLHKGDSIFTNNNNNNNNNNKTKYIVMSRDQTEGRSHGMKTDNRSFERAEEFKYLGTTPTNYIQEEIKSRLKSGNACSHLSKHLKIKIYRNIVSPIILYGCEIWSLILTDPVLC